MKMIINAYQIEQEDALTLAVNAFKLMPPSEFRTLKDDIEPYLDFRCRVDGFLETYFHTHCIKACYESRLSACCSKDGIITFWADVVINACLASPRQLEGLVKSIRHPHYESKCIFLSPSGCCWTIRPLNCAMFLCDRSQQEIFEVDPKIEERWVVLLKEAKSYRWPDRTVLFDILEKRFMADGHHSPLMYLNTSPGLLRIKKKAGIL